MKKRGVIFLILLFNLSLVLSATTSIVEFNYDFNKTSETDQQIHYTNSILLTIKTPIETECFYTIVEGAEPSNTFDKNYGTKHEKIIEDLTDGLHKYYIKCGSNSTNPIMKVSFKTTDTISATIELSEKPPLKAGTYDLRLITSTQVLGEPKLEYSYDGVVFHPLPLEGSGTVWTGHLIIEKNIGETVGSFRFKATDLSGKEGTKITNDKVFIVDTIPPTVIQNIEAIGRKGEIELSWDFNEEVKEYIIYRSENQGVDFTNEYKTTKQTKYLDTEVTNGQTYYYRVIAIDKAGNKGQFSKEVYATALLNNNTKKIGGLNPSLIGKVDNLLTEINILTQDINSVKQSINNKNDKEKQIYTDLDLSKEIDSSLSEINSLKKEVSIYKEQDLTELDLDKKLNAAKLKLNIIKKKVPESLTIINENEIKRKITEDDLTELILEYSQEQELTDKETKNMIYQTKKLIKNEQIKITSTLYNLDILYMDGSKKEKTLIKDIIDAKLERSSNTRFFLSVPKEIAEDTQELKIKKLNYEVIKEDPIIAFDADIKELIYTLEKHTEISKLKDIKLIPIKKDDEKSSNLITGYSFFDASSYNYENLGYIILGIIFLLLFSYFVYIKRKEIKEKEIDKKIKEAEKYKEEKNHKELEKIYKEIQEEYKTLTKKEKKKYYPIIKRLHEK